MGGRGRGRGGDGSAKQGGRGRGRGRGGNDQQQQYPQQQQSRPQTAGTSRPQNQQQYHHQQQQQQQQQQQNPPFQQQQYAREFHQQTGPPPPEPAWRQGQASPGQQNPAWGQQPRPAWVAGAQPPPQERLTTPPQRPQQPPQFQEASQQGKPGKRGGKKPPQTSPRPETDPTPPQQTELFEQSSTSQTVQSRAAETPLHVEELEQDPSVDQLAQQVQDSLTTSRSPTKFTAVPLVKRPPMGLPNDHLNCREIKLYANFFEIKLEGDPEIHHLDVDILPGRSGKVPPVRMNRAILDQALEDMRVDRYSFVYDGKKNLYGVGNAVPDEVKCGTVTRTVAIEEEGRTSRFEISISRASREPIRLTDILELMRSRTDPQLAARVSMADPADHLCILNVMDLCVRERAHHDSRCFVFGPKVFPEIIRNPVDLTLGRELWFGYSASVRPTWRVHLTVDVACKALPKAVNVHHYVGELLGMRGERDLMRGVREGDLVRLRKEIKGLKVKTHLNHTKMVADIARSTAATQTFFWAEENREVSVQEYFAKKYNIPLQFPQLPLILLHPKEKRLFVPMECCCIKPGQETRKKLHPKQQDMMVRNSALPPNDRLKKIQQAVRNSQFSQNLYLRNFGMHIEEDLAKIIGKILPVPQIGQTPSLPSQGTFKKNKFVRGATVVKWAFVDLVAPNGMDTRDFDSFCEKMARVGTQHGMTWPRQPPEYIAFYKRDASDFTPESLAGGLGKYRDYSILFFALPRKDSGYYARVKVAADQLLIVPSQVVVAGGKGITQKVDLLLQKVNAKLGGQNTDLVPMKQDPAMENVARLLGEPIMFIGADVTHPDSHDEDGRPSIAAVIGSSHRDIFSYAAQVRAQKPIAKRRAKESIDDMQTMVRNLLRKYRNNTGVYPTRIVYYRDGVSEGQFANVLNSELGDIRKAIRDLAIMPTPKITVLSVNKRHRTKFFPANPNDGEGKARNIPAGTVVDSQVVHPFNYDFYLCSHAGIQGTSRPVHYHVLHDDSNILPHTMYLLTYHLCFTYARCFRSVSYPPPTYYAHHCAMRCRHYMQYWFESASGASSVTGSSGEAKYDFTKLNEAIQRGMPDLFEKYPMFFI